MKTAFETWLAKEVAEKNLVDIKFAITAGKGVSVEAVQNQVLACELALEHGLEKSAPRATSVTPTHIREFAATVQ